MSTLCFVILLNASWALANAYLLRCVIPELAKPDISTCLPPWAAVAQARMTARLMLFCNVAVLICFPCIVYDGLVVKHGFTSPIMPGHAVGSFVGGAPSPSVHKLPPDVFLDMGLEIVEMLIGWTVCVYLGNLGGDSDDKVVKTNGQKGVNGSHKSD